MANDTIFIRCTACNARKRVTKYYPSLDLSVENPPELIDWLNDHLAHHKESIEYQIDLANNPGFIFETEATPP